MTSRRLTPHVAPLVIFLTVVLAHVVSHSAVAADRVALVIGNADYAEAPLRNPVNDARAMSQTLRELDFDVISLENADKQRMEQAIVRFAGRLTEDTVGVFYYAGHGVQVKARNYLVPVGADIGSEREMRIETVGVHLVLDEMAYANNRINIVILDACRNNPFDRRLRGRSRGLAAIDAARGTLIAYATAPGSVARDGDGANGLYTEELLRALREPGLEVEDVFKRVRVRVASRTGRQQIPWESSSLTGNFVFNPQGVPPVAQSASQKQAELLYWQSIRASDNPDVYRAYLSQFPNGTFADLARIRIDELGAVAASVSGSEAPATAIELAKAQPGTPTGPVASARETRKTPFVIGVVSPNGNLWMCVNYTEASAIARQAGDRIQAADGFTVLKRWFSSEETRHLWEKSGLRLKPVADRVFEYGRSQDLDGVLVLRYEVGGVYCESVHIEAYLFDIEREKSYRVKGNERDVPGMTGELVAEFAQARNAR